MQDTNADVVAGVACSYIEAGGVPDLMHASGQSSFRIFQQIH
jgi:hypothetical protein